MRHKKEMIFNSEDDLKDRFGSHEERDRTLFDRISHSYCKKDLSATGRIARRQRLRRSIDIIKLPSNATLLEVGCGAGFAADYLKGYYSSFHGLDYSGELIKYAEYHNKINGVSFSTENIKDHTTMIPYDVVFMIGVLHHLGNMEDVVNHIYHLMKPGGWLIANEPSPANPLISVARKLRKRVDNNYSDEQCEISESDLKVLFKKCGLTNIRSAPQGVLSTPFAEIPLPPQIVTAPLSAISCAFDTFLEKWFPAIIRRLSWNNVVAGQRPPS